MSDEEFYIDDDVRRWKQRGLSQEDAQIEAEWERTPDLTGINIPLVDPEANAASRAGESGFPLTPGPLVRIARKPIQRSEVQQLPGGVELPKFAGNTKDDSAKVPLSRGCYDYFPRALRHVAVISAGGAAKYDWNGWADVADGVARYRDACSRHDNAHAAGEVFDPDHSRYCSEPVRHLGQKVWNALAELELVLREEENENE